MSKSVKVEKFDTETNPFSIENMIKKEPKKEDSSNDSGYSANSEESGSENGLEKPLVSSFFNRKFSVDSVEQSWITSHLTRE